MEDAAKISELREKFTKKYDASSPRYSKFDPRDVNRILNDDLYALSFIHWKKDVIDDAVEMVADVLQWRAENKVGDLSVESIGMELFQRGACFIHGRDVEGNRVMTFVSGLLSKREREQTRKLLIFWLERIQRCEPGKHITFILDTHNTSMLNMDSGLVRFIIDCFVTYFPDIMERIIILDLPRIANAVCNVIMKWMTEEQKSRTIFCSRKDLHKYIAPEQLPESLGGKDPWTYSFPPFPDDLSQEHNFLGDVTSAKNGASGECTDQVELSRNNDTKTQ